MGRTGRAGRSGLGTTFVRSEDAHEVGRIAAALELHDEFAGGGFGRRRASTPDRSRPRPSAAGPPAAAARPGAGEPRGFGGGAGRSGTREQTAKTPRERSDERRRQKLQDIEEKVRDGSLVIRQMTGEERERMPARPRKPPRA